MELIFMIEYLGALWTGAGYFNNRADAEAFIKANAMRGNNSKDNYDIIPVTVGNPKGEVPQIPRGGVRMYRSASGPKQG